MRTTLKNLFISIAVFTGLLFFQSYGIAQDRTLSGQLIDKVRKIPVAGAEIKQLKTDNLSVTDSAGNFLIAFDKGSRRFQFSHQQYETLIHHQASVMRNKKLLLQMDPLKIKSVDTIWQTRKNALSFSVMELATGGIGLRYERFVHPRHSVGLHLTIYLWGFDNLLLLGNDYNVSFTGIKPVPFYRWYAVRSNAHGFFLEAKVPFGYFDFEMLPYTRNSGETVKNYPQDFWTIGAGFSLGWSFRLTPGNHGVGNFSIGMQIFPMDVPTTQTEFYEGNEIDYTLNNAWWYATGPGAFFEFKFTMGGLF